MHTDINECAMNLDDCPNCENSEGSYSCTCNEGYKLSKEENRVFCQGMATLAYVQQFYIHVCYLDINECEIYTINCHVNATCVNTNGSYGCMCNEGYSGDGITFCNGEQC